MAFDVVKRRRGSYNYARMHHCAGGNYNSVQAGITVWRKAWDNNETFIIY